MILVVNWRKKGSKKLKYNIVRQAVKWAKLEGAFDKDIPKLIKEVQSDIRRKRIRTARAPLLREQEQLQIMEEKTRYDTISKADQQIHKEGNNKRRN